MADHCSICWEEYNKSSKRRIECKHCKISTCFDCIKHFLLSSVNESQCSSCNKEWDIDFLATNTPKKFYNLELRKYRARIYLEREKSLLPETQPFAERELERKKWLETKKELLETRAQLQAQINKINWEIREREEYFNNNLIADENKEKRKFMHACPVNDCRGFLSTQWKCGICETWVCSKCMVIKNEKNDDNHICKQEDLDTCKLLRDNTKPCPNCAEGIYKINGCDVMFCTSCHTSFSWNSGKILTTNLHNPHYYEWQRNNNNGVAPRNRGDIPCGGLVGIAIVRNHLYKIINETRPNNFGYRGDINNDTEKFTNTFPGLYDRHRNIHHIIDIEMGRYNVNMIQDNQDLRIKYLLHEIDDTKWQLESR